MGRSDSMLVWALVLASSLPGSGCDDRGPLAESRVAATMVPRGAPVCAWVLNGDGHSHHTGNVRDAVHRLVALGVPPRDIFVASAGPRPHRRLPGANFRVANRQTLYLQRAIIASRLAPGGTLLVYLTGHGTRSCGRPETNTRLALHRSYMLTAEGLLDLVVSGVPPGRLLLVSDACYSGGFVKTLESVEGAYSGGSPTDERHVTYCQPFAPRFWGGLSGLDDRVFSGAFDRALDGCSVFRRDGSARPTCPHAPHGCPTYRVRNTFRQRSE